MSLSRIGKLWQWMTGPGADWTMLWLGLAMLTVALLVLTRTRWGQSRALEKCVFLSLLAHLLLAGLATTVQLVHATAIVEQESVVVQTVTLTDGVADEAVKQPVEPIPQREPKPWETFVTETPVVADPAKLNRQRVNETPELRRTETVIAASATETTIPDPKRTPQHPSPDDSLRMPLNRLDRPKKAERIETEPVERKEQTATVAPIHASPQRAVATDEVTREGQTANSSVGARIDVTTPRLARLPNRQHVAEAFASDVDVASRITEPSPPSAAERSAPNESIARVESPVAPTRREKPTTASRKTASTVDRGNATDFATAKRAPAVRRPAGGDLPKTYQLRVDPDRMTRARQNGATAATEAAVEAALKWLAAHQNADGRWDADRLGAGRETGVAGHDRLGAGTQADTGITGLALLAFLGSGQTHLNGPYRDNIRRGLEFLLRSQDQDGNLAGEARLYARMYCHGMASFALSEGYAVSGDQRLRPSVRDAIAYTANSQHRVSGGWRYQPGDLGDMSQFGWQVMALHSADLAGVEFPLATRRRATQFLRNSRAGLYGGRAAYRVGQATNRVMTAEALVCRQFLGLTDDKRISTEAGDYILDELPGSGRADFYYWYYATISMFQLQGEYWRRWNEALRPALVERQRLDGDLAGSWDPDTRWGSYGGRAYSTAMAALCLEVYYRYLPKTAPVERSSR